MPPVLPISGSELRRATVTVDDFLAAGAVPLQLALVAGAAGRRNPIPEGALNRPGLALSGFLTFFANRRIQILGFHEWSYLGSVTPEERAAKLRAVFAQQLPAVIVCRGLNLDEVPELKPLADETKTPLLTTPMLTHEFVNAATLIIEELASPYRIVHGTMIAASLHPAIGPLSPNTPTGTTYGTTPSACCVSRTSCIHFAKNPRTSAK